jgi:death on curing protein
MLELSKMAWSPVLELLGREIRFDELALRPYSLDEVTQAPLTLGLDPQDRELTLDPQVRLRWLTTRDIVQIHDEMIATFGGEPGVMNRGRIDNALETAFQSPIPSHDPFPSIIDKAASLLHSILLYHPFVDGQKRTGISSAFVLLGVNGFFMWSRDPADEVHFAIHVAQGEFEVPEIARWIASRVIPPAVLRDPSVVSRLLPYAQHSTRACTACHHQIRVNRYQVTCSSCGSKYVVVLNAGLYQGRASGDRFFVQAGLKRVGQSPIAQRTLDVYLDRREGGGRRRGRPQSSS